VLTVITYYFIFVYLYICNNIIIYTTGYLRSHLKSLNFRKSVHCVCEVLPRTTKTHQQKMGKNQEALGQNSNVSEANFRDMFETADVFCSVWQELEYFMWND